MKHLIVFWLMATLGISLSAQTMNLQSARKWMQSKVWNNGWEVAPHQSVNAVEFAKQYTHNKELWDAMFKFLAEHDLNRMDLGTYQISKGRCWATVSEYLPKTADKGNIESHKNFIDLQYVLHGNEQMGLAKHVIVKKEYNPARDVAFWTSKHIKYFPATADAFFLFFPCDIHQPSIQAKGEVVQSRKVVIKIEYVTVPE